KLLRRSNSLIELNKGSCRTPLYIAVPYKYFFGGQYANFDYRNGAPSMSLIRHLSLALSMSLICPVFLLAQSSSSSPYDELAAAWAKTTTEEEIAKLLGEKKEFMDVKLVDALNRLWNQKYAEGVVSPKPGLASQLLLFDWRGSGDGRASHS